MRAGVSDFWLSLLVKMAATAVVIVTATHAAERGGPFWGALIAALPVAAGPAYVLLSLQADSEFVAASALSSLATTGASVMFATAVALLATRCTLAVALALAFALWFAAAVPIGRIDWTPATAALLNAAVYAMCFAVTVPVVRRPVPAVHMRRRWFDHPLRALLVSALVGGVVTASDAIGPRATGMAAVFPITFTCLIIVLVPRLGGAFTAITLARAIRAMVGFSGFLLVLHLATAAWSPAWGLGLGLATSILYSLGMIVARRALRAR
jgi:hypothetical protein